MAVESSVLFRKVHVEGRRSEVYRLVGTTRPRRFEGVVQHGAKLGRTIGFPTANVAISGARPRIGIHAARAELEDGRVYPGVAYYGSRPTVDGKGELLEVFLFGFDEEIYGMHMSVDLIGFIRSELKFSSVDEMKRQIERDCVQALARLEVAG